MNYFQFVSDHQIEKNWKLIYLILNFQKFRLIVGSRLLKGKIFCQIFFTILLKFKASIWKLQIINLLVTVAVNENSVKARFSLTNIGWFHEICTFVKYFVKLFLAEKVDLTRFLWISWNFSLSAKLSWYQIHIISHFEINTDCKCWI